MLIKKMVLWMRCSQCGKEHYIFDLIDPEKLQGPHAIGAYKNMMHDENCPDCNMSFGGGKYIQKGCSSEHTPCRLYGYPESAYGVEVIESPKAAQELTPQVVSTIGYLERTLAELKDKIYRIPE